MNISTFDKVMAVVCAVMLVFLGAAGAVAMGASAPSGDTNQAQPTQTATPTPETADSNEVPPRVNQSYDGAMLLKEELKQTETFSDSKVYIAKSGEVIVEYSSDVQYGTELKGEMAEVAMVYAEVMAEHPETGGLTVTANNVAMLVSSDTALAYAEGDIKQSAYEETFTYKTANETETEG